MKSSTGTLTFIGTYIFFLVVALTYAPFSVIFHDLSLFFSGQALSIEIGAPSFIEVMMLILGLAAIELPLMFLCLQFMSLSAGSHKGSHGVNEMVKCNKEDRKFANIWLLVFFEEAFARGLFLGVFAGYIFTSTFAFYFFFLLGNGIWAFIHLANYKNEKDRKLIRVLPQFISGIFLTYVFVKYGLIVAVIAHFVFNSMIFCMYKQQNTDMTDLFQTLLSAGYALLGYCQLEKPLSDIMTWFYYSEDTVFALPGWGFWDYLWLNIFIGGCVSLIFDVLLYDRTGIGKEDKKDKENDVTGGKLAIAIPLLLVVVTLFLAGMYSLGFWISGWFFVLTPTRVLFITIMPGLLVKSNSYSGAIRHFWTLLSIGYVSFCIYQAMGLGEFILYFMICMLFAIPKVVLNLLDD